MKSPRQPGASRWAALGAGMLVLVAVVFGAVALSSAATSKPNTLGMATAKLSGPSGNRTEPVAVNARGVAVYELAPETTHHLLCTKGNGCFALWPPVKVKSKHPTKARGVKGRLGTLRRDGFLQLTLNGHPLYTFVEDGGRKGVAAGDGLHSFKGVWHVFAEGKSTSSGGSTPPGGSGSGSPPPPTYGTTTASGTPTSGAPTSPSSSSTTSGSTTTTSSSYSWG